MALLPVFLLGTDIYYKITFFAWGISCECSKVNEFLIHCLAQKLPEMSDTRLVFKCQGIMVPSLHSVKRTVAVITIRLLIGH